jgi:hypothetical protein
MLENLSVGTKIIILVVIGIVVIAAVVLGFLYFTRQEAPEPEQPIVNETQPPPRQPIQTGPEQRPELNLPELSPEEKSKEQIQTLARIFAERYGSFSNQGNFQNLSGIEELLTENMKSYVKNQKAQLAEKYPADGEYYGVTTVAPIVRTLNFTENSATILVITQRRETRDNETRNFDQEIKVEFKKQNGEWLIDGAYWQ